MVKVLVLEDDPAQREVLVGLVQLCGHRAIPCASLQEARAAVPWDVALVDANLPDGSGLEFARAAGNRVFLVTGADIGEDEAGVPVLRKPVRPADLERALR